MERQSTPSTIVIFGITGDLARRKLLPALYHLTRDNLLHKDTKIIGVTRQKITKEIILDNITTSRSKNLSKATKKTFSNNFSLESVDLTDQDDYKKLKQKLDDIDIQTGIKRRKLFYLSVPPAVMDEIIAFMGRAGLNKDKKYKPLLLIEKPFGYDTESAKKLISVTRKFFKEEQIYRIDHYLAKETAQNILEFRFKNPLFHNVWSNRHIGKINIIAHEKIGIENRIDFYEQTGALRDLIQSHLLLLLSLVLMKKPKNCSAKSIHTSRYSALKKINNISPDEVKKVSKRGQYKNYRKDSGNPHSNVETFASLRLSSNDISWHNVPILLETGKAMAEKTTKIIIEFKNSAHLNTLTLQIQPDEGIYLSINVKKPGHDKEVVSTVLDFQYKNKFSDLSQPESYEKVLLEAVSADQTLFTTSKEVLACWNIIQPILDEWQKTSDDLQIY